MARVSADTLKIRGGGGGGGSTGGVVKRGRKPVNGNSAQGETPLDDVAVELGGDEEGIPTDPPLDEEPTDETPAPPALVSAPAAQRRIPKPETRAALPMAQQADADQAKHYENEDLLALGKLARYALENGIPMSDCVEDFRDMVAAFDRHIVR